MKLNVKSARQPINLAYILLSFLDKQNSSFPFFCKIKQQETTYTVRFFFFFPSTAGVNSASAQYSKLQLKPLKTAGAQHSLEDDLLKNCSKTLHVFLLAFTKLTLPTCHCHHTNASCKCYFSCSISQGLAFSLSKYKSIFLLSPLETQRGQTFHFHKYCQNNFD